MTTSIEPVLLWPWSHAPEVYTRLHDRDWSPEILLYVVDLDDDAVNKLLDTFFARINAKMAMYPSGSKGTAVAVSFDDRRET